MQINAIFNEKKHKRFKKDLFVTRNLHNEFRFYFRYCDDALRAIEYEGDRKRSRETEDDSEKAWDELIKRSDWRWEIPSTKQSGSTLFLKQET